MNTLILYATKYGAAREIAQRIASRIGCPNVYDLKSHSIPSIGQYDCVIIGSSLYAGMIRKEAKAFLAQNTAALSGKTVGLYLSGMGAADESDYFSSSIPASLLNHAKAAEFLGGIFSPEKCNFIERFIMKKVAKRTEYTNTISDEKIASFVEALTE